MAPRLLGLAVLALAGLCRAEIFYVNDGSDSVSHTTGCPGDHCTLRAAWTKAKGFDSILLNVSVELVGPLTGAKRSRIGDEIITMTGLRKGLSIKPKVAGSMFRFISSNFVFTSSSRLGIRMENFELTGFSYKGSGAVLCIGYGPEGYTGCGSSASEPEDSSVEPPQPRGAQRKAARPTPFVGKEEKKSAFKALKMFAVSITGNTAELPKTESGGIISLRTNQASPEVPTYLFGVQFRDNIVTSAGSVVGSVFNCGSDGSDCPFSTEGCFVVNNTFKAGAPSTVEGYGAALSSYGNIDLADTEIIGNTIENGVVVSAMGTHPDSKQDVTLDTSIITQNKRAVLPMHAWHYGAVWGAHLHIKQSLITVEAGTPATYSLDDQYFEASSVSNIDGSTCQINGYQIFNRNPTFSNFATNSTAGLGFADCKQGASWLPCPNPAGCQNIMNLGKVVGYKCL